MLVDVDRAAIASGSSFRAAVLRAPSNVDAASSARLLDRLEQVVDRAVAERGHADAVPAAIRSTISRAPV